MNFAKNHESFTEDCLRGVTSCDEKNERMAVCNAISRLTEPIAGKILYVALNLEHQKGEHDVPYIDIPGLRIETIQTGPLKVLQARSLMWVGGSFEEYPFEVTYEKIPVVSGVMRRVMLSWYAENIPDEYAFLFEKNEPNLRFFTDLNLLISNAVAYQLLKKLEEASPAFYQRVETKKNAEREAARKAEEDRISREKEAEEARRTAAIAAREIADQKIVAALSGALEPEGLPETPDSSTPKWRILFAVTFVVAVLLFLARWMVP